MRPAGQEGGEVRGELEGVRPSPHLQSYTPLRLSLGSSVLSLPGLSPQLPEDPQGGDPGGGLGGGEGRAGAGAAGPAPPQQQSQPAG